VSGNNTVRWSKGYTQQELDRAQQRFGLVFPPDLIALLRQMRPVEGHDWTNDAEITRALAWPLEGLLFDVERNNMWWSEWGVRPADAHARREVLTSVVSRAPKLIPLIAHRYLPQEPHEQGNPVFSIHQSDVVYYGANLEDYFAREFLGYDHRPWIEPTKHIPFWSDLVQWNNN
jgi:hypothetical protein